MGKRANIKATARATGTLVWQNRAAHLRQQGLLDPSAGPVEARAHDRAAATAAQRARIEALPGGWAAHRAWQIGAVAVVAVAALSVVLSSTGVADPAERRSSTIAEVVCPALDADKMADPLSVVPDAMADPGVALADAAAAIDSHCSEHHDVAVMWRGVASSLVGSGR